MGRSSNLVRLLEVDPVLTQEGLLQCRLHSAKLAPRKSYRAVSYTWGLEYPCYTILINGYRFELRTNAHAFLCVARQHYHSSPLWIDAICIDQQSVEECNYQVGFMLEVYEYALETLVWLGEGSVTIEGALHDLSSLQPPENDPLYQSQLERRKSRIPLQAVTALCYLPYWSRTWVVQEFTLSRHKTLYYGREWISASTLATAIHLLCIGRSDETKMIQQSPAQALLFAAAQGGLRSSSGQGLVHLYLRYAETQCSDFHNRVYALRALVARGSHLPVDYSLSRLELIFVVMSFAIYELFLFGLDYWNNEFGDYLNLCTQLAEQLQSDFDIERAWVHTDDGPRWKYCSPIRYMSFDMPDRTGDPPNRLKIDKCWPYQGDVPFGTFCELTLQDVLHQHVDCDGIDLLPRSIRQQLDRDPGDTIHWLERQRTALIGRGRGSTQRVIARFRYLIHGDSPQRRVDVYGEVSSNILQFNEGVPGVVLHPTGGFNHLSEGKPALELTDTCGGVLLFGLPSNENLRRLYIRELCRESGYSSAEHWKIFTMLVDLSEKSSGECEQVRWA